MSGITEDELICVKEQGSPSGAEGHFAEEFGYGGNHEGQWGKMKIWKPFLIFFISYSIVLFIQFIVMIVIGYGFFQDVPKIFNTGNCEYNSISFFHRTVCWHKNGSEKVVSEPFDYPDHAIQMDSIYRITGKDRLVEMDRKVKYIKNRITYCS